EDQLDYETGIQALKRFEENPITYSIDDLIEELENDL
ncbi:translation repressor RelB, partial [Streptococcus dysgalactiae]